MEDVASVSTSTSEQTQPPAEESTISLQPQLTPVVNYALQQNRLPILSQLIIRNHTDQVLQGLTLTAESDPEGILLPFSQLIEQVPAQSEFVLQRLPVHASADMLSGLTEGTSGYITLRLLQGDELLAECRRELTVLAFDQWHGVGYYPELLTAFITPNHPEVAKLTSRAAEFLKQWTDDPSQDAYLRENPNRVRLQAASVYAAMQEQNIVYSIMPASFETVGQRVRLCDTIIQEKKGNCLELTLLYAACLEAIGLNPLVVVIPGHAFAGVWLEEQTFPEAVQDDPALLTKRLSDGIGEVAVVECTALTAGKKVSFDEACAMAERQLNTPVEYIIDVRRARLSGIRPIPQRIRTEDGWSVVSQERDEEEITSAPKAREQAVQVGEGPAAAGGKVAQWERKLLDLGLRNTLLNLRLTQNVVPLLADSLGKLEDMLASGEEYGISPRPQEWAKREAYRRDPEQFADLGEYRQLIQAEFENKRLRSALNEADLARATIRLYRTAHTSLEENGANTLYLALGLLRWYESKASERPRYAPLVLLPVEIVRKSAIKGYVIRLRDEEPQMNITLLEMLKQDFGITVGGLDPLPQDDHGVDLRAVYAVIRRAVMDQPRWDVVETAFLGLFSFTQFVMWNDLRNRADDLQRNKLVRSLIEGKLAWADGAMETDAKVEREDTLLPIPADASQLYAIQQAADGRSFVLHGPPGTGKSQTITALIANALAQGKTVLFVAEKMAALSVVQKRLDGIGIGAFCLELHSNKSKKRDVLDQLKAATEVTRGKPKESWEKKAAQTAALRKELDDYAQALHMPRPCGYSLFELVGFYEDNREAPAIAPLTEAFIRSASRDRMTVQEQAAGRLVAAGREVGHPAGHPLRLLGRREYSPALRTDMADKLHSFLQDLDRLETAGKVLAEATGQPVPQQAAQWEKQFRFAGQLLDWLKFPASWTCEGAFEELLGNIDRFSQHIKAAQQVGKTLSVRWKDSFLQQDAAALKAAWTQASLQWVLPRMLGQGRVVKLLAPHAKGGVDKGGLEQDLTLLETYRSEMQQAGALHQTLGAALNGLNENAPDDLRVMTGQARELCAGLRQLTDRDTPAKLGGQSQLIPLAQELRQACTAVRADWEKLLPLLQPDEARCAALTISEMGQMCREAAEGLEGLKDWCVWNEACAEARELEMGSLVEAYAGGLPHDQVLCAWRRAVTVALISSIVDGDPVLSRFSGAIFNEKIRQFQQLDDQLTRLAQTEIFCRLAANVPDFTQAAASSSEVGILQRAIRSGGRGLSLRRLFDQIPTLLPLLCPCMLMSPLSVAQYLDPGHKDFDLVVFDEASQLPTCKAVGALARGENAVVVGDPKQMPPTSFFTSNTVDEENLEQEDLESILDDCLALNMPQSHLLWHYRSQHESLIAFSNREFYDNRLYTFPSVNDRESMVRLVHVDGFFDRGKTRQNRGEAEAVVAELSNRAHDPALRDRSVGVVTFNINQQNLISDLLDEACRTDSVLEDWAYHSPEPLFIKNLENVQGDERDVILFSIGYGPDEQGHVTMNFGPLNREGGWRRLNVAVSRARQEMVVYATLRPDQIDLSRSPAQGVAALRDFLAYAESGTLKENAASAGDAGTDISGIVRDIRGVLEENGYGTQCMVGHSKYRLDIGVVDPAQPEQYLAGILLDGRNYRDARTTRDRELAQCMVLERLGWRLHRIWTMDWLEQRKKETERLLAHLKELEEAKPVPAEASTPEPARIEKNVDAAVAEIEAGIPQGQGGIPYRPAKPKARQLSADDFLLPRNQRLILSVLSQVIKQEGPVSEGLLLRRTVQSFGITRAGSRMQNHLQTLLSTLDVRTTVQQDSRFYWAPSQEPDSYTEFRTSSEAEEKRDARDLPVQEIANAAVAVLRQQVGLPEEDLIREAARLLGYTRLGVPMRQAMSSGLAYGMEHGRLSQSRPGYYVLPQE
ncbi:DUF3320 domain-containing protein [Pseudoflavonifractor capillosus]|nr:DUF3320 domain-containing protein [Pseudoflavonifractor capillosus]